MKPFKKQTEQFCFRDRPYYPVYLANGVDAVMVNITGSGDSWWENSDYSSMLTLQHCRGWYKSDRRIYDTQLVYGRLIPLFEFSSNALINEEMIVPKNCRQVFDPETATVTTFYSQLDNQSLQELEIKVTTFLTNDHILVEHYEFLKTPETGASIQFFINAPSKARLDMYPEPVVMDSFSLETIAKNSLMICRFSKQNINGIAISWFDCPAKAARHEYPKKTEFIALLRTCNMKKGQSFTRYLIVIDNRDQHNFEDQARKILQQCQNASFQKIHSQHRNLWKDYFSTSIVNIPDPAVLHIYKTSRYIIRANLHPSGFLPMGIMPYLWQGVMFWDACFAVEAMLGCGNFSEAKKVLEHLIVYQDEGKKLAQAHNSKGIRLEWTAEEIRFTDYGFLTKQIHNNAMWAHQIFQFYHYTGEIALLKKLFPFAQDLLFFIVSGFLQDRKNYIIVKRCEGVDESTVIEKINDTWTSAITLKALMEYRDAAKIPGIKSEIKNIERIIKKIEAGLNMNVDENGIMQSFKGGKLPHWGSLIFDLFPLHPCLKPTIKKMMENYDKDMDTYNFHGVTRYAEKMFPWANWHVARILSRIGDSHCMEIIDNAARYTNYFGGIPERIFYHGEFFNHWFLTAHAAMVWAINGICANLTGDDLRILVSSCHKWKDVSFENICAGGGLVVSADMKKGKIQNLVIDNLLKKNIKINCIAGTEKPFQVSLNPGKNKII
ncbi:MAG: hypothetical protein NC931_00890 [Candidatus Omnitrophica bacterium]|nr:hypothetical protein [Candidatus Omnitrophota bacterium]